MSPDIPFETRPTLPTEDVPQHLELLYRQAIAARPQLHAALAEVNRDRNKVALAQLDYYPDFTFSAGWVR